MCSLSWFVCSFLDDIGRLCSVIVALPGYRLYCWYAYVKNITHQRISKQKQINLKIVFVFKSSFFSIQVFRRAKKNNFSNKTILGKFDLFKMYSICINSILHHNRISTIDNIKQIGFKRNSLDILTCIANLQSKGLTIDYIIWPIQIKTLLLIICF